MIPAARHIQADAHRAKQAGFKTVDLHVDDVIEMVAAYESALAHQKIAFSGKHAGWIDPKELARCLEGEKRHVFMGLKRSKRERTELFYTDDLPRAVRVENPE